MPKSTKKPAAKKTATKTAKKPAAKKTPAKKNPAPALRAARARTATATPARVMSRKRGGMSEITAVIGSVTTEDISLRAYFIGERRRHLGLPGDAESDWLEAEQQLRG